MMRLFIGGAVLVALAGCGETRDGNKPTGEATAKAAPAGWNAMDACATVGTPAVAAAMGKAVTGTALDPVSQPDGLRAGFSMCTFTLADGAKLTVLTREAADGDAYDAAVAAARKIGEEFGSPAVDVAGIGKAAMWTARPAALQVFLDDRRYATISLFGADFMPDGSEAARSAATAIARKLAS
ncbi:hypothetical protein [Glacieibacterium frigidum]|uniref:DUF3558 domain-containing protein n=1 Tax=Glacieibacterium frigidum TaxID=2593303 RepID=A0A552UAD1_9SPHN|nr:hypothetical protein [Glacieibacterium frigidum]TRW15168.1 hypothetical protein FMM06_16145 [Glacieibacterium frigidum]